MKKLSFTEKNNFVLRHKAARYFSPDLELFRRTFLTHRLNTELSRANLHTYDRLDGQMLYVLLDALPPGDILANRNPPPSTPEEAKNPGTAPDGSAVAEELATLKNRIDELESSASCNEDELSGLRSALDDSETSIDDLQSAVEELEKKAFNKKKASAKSSPP